MLKQRKHSPFDDQSSPDGSHYLRKDFFFSINYFDNYFHFYNIDVKDDDDDMDDDDDCSSDGSESSQKALVFAE